MGVIARHRNMEDWSVSLGNTLLASIVCLLWYVFGLWEEKDKVTEEGVTLTSAEKKVRSAVDKSEENFNNGSGHLCCTSRTEGGHEGHLYMLPEEGRHLLLEQSKQRQEDTKKFGCEEAKPNNVPVAAECRGVGVCKTTKLNGAFQHTGRQAEGSWDIQDWRG